jgi:hypothetical protein
MPNEWLAAAFAVLLSLASFNSGNTLPLVPMPQVTGTPDVTLVADCGPGFRNENGRCLPDASPRVFPPPAMPVDVAPPVRCGP